MQYLNDYIKKFGKSFSENNAALIDKLSIDLGRKVKKDEIIFDGVTWTPSCKQSQFLFESDEDDVKKTIESSICVCVEGVDYWCFRELLFQSAYLDTLLSTRWMDTNGDREKVTLELSANVFLPGLYTCYGYIPMIKDEKKLKGKLDWLLTVAEYLALPTLKAHCTEYFFINVYSRITSVSSYRRLFNLLSLLHKVEDPVLIDKFLKMCSKSRFLLFYAANVELMAGFEPSVEDNFYDTLFKRIDSPSKTIQLLLSLFHLDERLAGWTDASERGHALRQVLSKQRTRLVTQTAESVDPGLLLRAAHEHVCLEGSGDSTEELNLKHLVKEIFTLVTQVDGLVAAFEGLRSCRECCAKEMELLTDSIARRLPQLMTSPVWHQLDEEAQKSILSAANFFGVESGQRPLPRRPHIRNQTTSGPGVSDRRAGMSPSSRRLLGSVIQGRKRTGGRHDVGIAENHVSPCETEDANVSPALDVQRPPAQTFLVTELVPLTSLTWIQSHVT